LAIVMLLYLLIFVTFVGSNLKYVRRSGKQKHARRRVV